jgi:uncharacterized protein (TIRG00374 family)
MKKSTLKYVLHIVVLIGLIVAGAKYLSGDEVIEALRAFDYSYAPFMIALSLTYLGLKGWRFVLLTRPVAEDLPWYVTFKAFVAGQAAALVPGGIAVRAGLLNQADVPVGRGSIPVLLNSGLDQAVFITGSLIAALWFEWARTPVFIVLSVLIVAGLILVIPPSRHWLLTMIEWAAKKFNLLDQWREFLKAAPEVFTPFTILTTLALTVAAFACHVIALDLTLRGVGAVLPYSSLTLAYILPTALGRLSGLPGGVGVTEAGMVGFLTSTSDLGNAAAFAASAIFRIVTILLPAAIGALIYFFGWRGEEEAEAATPASAPSQAK